MIENTLICFFVYTHQINTGEVVINNEIELVCVETDTEIITDIPEINGQKPEEYVT